VPWPFAMREVILSAFELEYFDEDLVAVLYNTVRSSIIFCPGGSAFRILPLLYKSV